MSKDRKGFLVYGDIQEVVKRLSDEEAGQLLKGMLGYFVDGKDPKFSGVLEFVFIPIKQQMDRDAEKYIEKCEKMRENAQKRWQNDAKAYNGMQMYANDANTKTNTDTNTKTDKDTKTKTKTKTTTDTNTNVGGGDYDDEFNIFKLLGGDGIDKVYDEYPNTGGDLIQEVFESVRSKRTVVKNPVAYVLGYAKRVGWDDNADHFDGGGMA